MLWQSRARSYLTNDAEANLKRAIPVVAILALLCATSLAPAQAPRVADSDIVDAYEYMLARWLVLRQEALDFKAGFKWNEVIHRAPGDIAQAHPNFDVALSEAWIAVDDTSCTLINLPEIKGRYYTVEIVNGWGEVIDNINERTYPTHPFGTFAFCRSKAKVDLPAGAERVEVAGNTSRILMPIELGDDPAEALALQKQITMQATGSPKIDDAVVKPDFPDDKLPGVEAFDKTDEILASETDINKGMADLQSKARSVAAAAADPAQRAHIDEVVQSQAIPAFLAAIAKMSPTMNGWVHPRITGNYGNDYLTRSIVDFTGIWANGPREAVYFDGTGFDGSQTYTQTYPKDAPPAAKARYFWSVVAVDAKDDRVIANPLDRYLLNNQSGLKRNADGSLTLVFAPKLPDGVPQSNWLPTPAGQDYNLTYRFYGPVRDVMQGRYYPPLLSIRP
jgi:hypothetical protein